MQHGSDDCISLTTVNVKLQHAPLAASYLAAAVTSRCLGNCSRQKNKYFSSWCRKMRILENSCCRCAALQHCRCLGLDAFILTATDVQTLQHYRLLLHAPVPADIPFHLLKEWRLPQTFDTGLIRYPSHLQQAKSNMRPASIICLCYTIN